MNEAQIDQIQQQLFQQYVTNPTDLEQEITSVAKDVARRIMLGTQDAVHFGFLGDPFIIRAKPTVQGNQRIIMMVISNEATRKIAGNKYVPFTVSSEIDNNFSLLENYEAIIETFLRHIAGTDKPEILDDED